MPFIDPDDVTEDSSQTEHERVMGIIEEETLKSIPKEEQTTAFVDPDEAEAPTIMEEAVSDAEALVQTVGSIGSAAVLAIPGAMQAAGDWLLTGDVEAARRGMDMWVKKGYVPSNPSAAAAVEIVGRGFEHLAEETEKLLGPEARMATEIGMVAAPFTPGLKVKPAPATSIIKQTTPVTKAKARIAKGIESDIIDSPDVRLLKHAPELQGRLRQMEAEGFRKGVEHNAAVEPFLNTLDMIRKSSPETYTKIQKAYLNQPKFGSSKRGAGISEVRKLVSKEIGPKAASRIFAPLEAALRQRAIELKDVAPSMRLIQTSYLPRRVIHPEKLNIDMDGPVGKKLQQIDRKVADGRLDPLTAEELRTEAITTGVRKEIKAATSGHEKTRKVYKLTDEQMEAYAPLEEALPRYFEETGWSVAEKKFLGKGVTTEAAIGKFMEGFSSHPKANAIHKVLKARFGPTARRGVDKGWNNLKELGYIGTIADFASAVIQLSDIAGSIARQGFVPGMKAVYQSVGKKASRTKRGAIDPEVVGIVDIMHEMAVVRGGMNKLLDNTLRVSGFKATDRLGKRTLLTAARNRLMKEAKNKPEKLRKQYWWMKEAEFNRFKKNVAEGNPKNPDTQFALVNELLDVQPMSLSQMPIKYLEMRNGKIFYALKTWAIRQINRYREDAIKGDYNKALRYAAGLYAATESIDFAESVLISALTGAPLEVEDVQDDAINNLLRMMFLSTYSLGKVKGGDTEEALSSAVNLMPAGVGVVGDVAIGIWKTLTGEGAPAKAVKRIPIVGRSVGSVMED